VALRASGEPPECLSPGREHIPTKGFKDAPVIVPGQLAKKRWGQIFILDFVRNTGVIHKKVGVFECGMRIAECGIQN